MQSWARRTLAKRYAKRLRKAIIVIKRNVKKWVKNKQIFDEQARKRKKKNRKKKARKKMIRKVNRIQAFWRKRKFRKENLYMTKFAIEVLKFNRTIDTVIEKLKPHYDEIIQKLQDICRQVRQKSIVAVYGSYGNGLFVPSSDIDLVVSFRTYANIAPPFFGDLSFRQAVPRSVSNVGNMSTIKARQQHLRKGVAHSVKYGNYHRVHNVAWLCNSDGEQESLSRELVRSITCSKLQFESRSCNINEEAATLI